MKSNLIPLARGAIGQVNVNAKGVCSLFFPLSPVNHQIRFTGIVETAHATVIAVAGSTIGTVLSGTLTSRLLENCAWPTRYRGQQAAK